MREVVFDTETTGIRIDLGHRIVEFGAVELVDGTIGRHLQFYFNPERAMDAGAYEVHGLSDEFLADKPLFADKLADILTFIGDAPLVAHNADFDRDFLNHELKLADYPPLRSDRFIDTLKLSRQHFKTGRHTLDALCQRLEIDTSDRTLHGALKDSTLLAKAYLKMMTGTQMSMSLRPDSPTHAGVAPTIDADRRRTPFARRTVEPRTLTGIQDRAHRTFLDEHIPESLWQKFL